MNKLKISLNDILNMLVILLISAIVFFIVLFKFGNSIMPIKEYVVDTVVFSGTNPLLEQNLFWILTFFGIINLFFLIKNKKNTYYTNTIDDNISKAIILTLAALLIYIYKSYLPNTLIFILLSFLLFIAIFKKYAGDIFYLFIFISLDLCTIFYIFSINNINTNLSLSIGLIASLFLGVYIVKYNNKILNKIILIFQILLPLAFIIYLKNQYTYSGSPEFENQILTLKSSINVYIFFHILIALLIFSGIYFAIKNWKNLEVKISIPTIITISSLVSFTRTSKFIGDGHHLAEYIISYNQIFEHGNIPYVTYFPVSGLFPLILGLLQKIFALSLNDVYLTINIFNIICIIIIILLLNKYLDRKKILFISLFIPFANEYVRANLLLIYLLILFLPYLQEKIGAWLLSFAILSYIVVFFYPIFGISIFLGISPFAINKLYLFFKNKYYIKCFKNITFIICFILELILFILSIPSILGLIRHIIIYSKQSLLSNSITRFGSEVPGEFLTWINNFEGFRKGLWYLVGYIFIILIIFITSLLLFKATKNYGLKSILNNDMSALSFSILIMLLVSSRLTIQRQDTFTLLARAGFIIFPFISLIIIILLDKYFLNNYSKLFIFSLIIFLAGVGFPSGLYSLDGTYSKIENFDSGAFAYISQANSKRYKNLGAGFIPKYLINDLEEYKNITDQLLYYDKNLSFLGLDQAVIVSLDLKTVSQPTMFEIKTKARVKEFIRNIEKEQPVIFTKGIYPNHSHDFYKWILTTYKYVYSAEYKAYLPKTLATQLSIQDDNRLDSVEIMTDLGNIPSNLGKSFKYLQKKYDKTDFNIYYTEPMADEMIINNETNESTNISESFFKFDNEITGLEANYLYLELERENKNSSNLSELKSPFLKAFTKEVINDNLLLTLSWKGEEGRANFINCKMSDGRLFIPLEANVNWLLNKHKGFKISIRGLEKGENVHIKNIKLLKSKDL